MVLRLALLEAKARGLWVGDLEVVVPRGFATGYEPRKAALTIVQVWELIKKLEPHRAARVAFAVATSAERGAVDRARSGDIPSGVEYVHVRGTKRRKRDRIVAVVLPWQRKLLDFARKNASRENGQLFEPWDNDTRDLELGCSKANVPRVTTNDLRRSYAVNMRLEGLPFATIAPDMGHADTRMLERVYGRLTPEQLAAEKRAILSARRRPTLTVIRGAKSA